MPRARQEKLDRIAADNAFDVIVVGGGINGIGVFRELALQGLRVLLVEQHDFCSGCSAAPSRMIHGGLRYLENGELSLVKESLRERDALMKNAPHLVQRLPTTVPITGVFSGLLNSVAGFLGYGSKPTNRGAVPIKLGLTLYDWLTRKRRTFPRHAFRGEQATRAIWPELSPGVRFSATYFDAWISYPERLGVELICDAERVSPASVALNYATVTRHEENGMTLVDNTGGPRMNVSAKVIVNATGAWVDKTKSALAPDDARLERLVYGTKGSHLIIDNPLLRAALNGHMMYFENADGRICIAFPYLGRVLVGSTDIRVEEARRVRCEDTEKEYILASLGRLFPGIRIVESEIVFSYSGIRPLARSNHAFTGRISRGHFIKRIPGDIPQLVMVGGKWTTFRAFAEQTSDLVLEEIGTPRVCDTIDIAIGGGDDFPSDRGDLAGDICRRFGATKGRANHLADHYGTNGQLVQAHCAGLEWDRPLTAESAYSTGEIDYLVRHEYVVRLSDVVLRRTALAITGQVSDQVIDAVIEVMSPLLSWTNEQSREERTSLVAELRDFYGVSAARLSRNSENQE